MQRIARWPQGPRSARRREGGAAKRNGSSRGLPAEAGEGWHGTRACWKGALRAPAGRGLGWGWGPGVAAWSPRGCDVSAGGHAPVCHLCPGQRPWCRPPGSALPARGSTPQIRQPTALTRAWHPCTGTVAGRGGGNHSNGHSASLPALQPRPVLVAAEARSLPPCPYTCIVSHLVMADSATPWTVAHQPPLSGGLSRQECWSG